MAEISGTAGSVVLVINGTASVDSIADWNANFGRESYTYQKFGNTMVQRKVGAGDVTGRFTGQWNSADTSGQVKLKNAWSGGSVVELRLYDAGTTYWSGSAFITSIGQTTPQAGMVTCEFGFEGNGSTWTYT